MGMHIQDDFNQGNLNQYFAFRAIIAAEMLRATTHLTVIWIVLCLDNKGYIFTGKYV